MAHGFLCYLVPAFVMILAVGELRLFVIIRHFPKRTQEEGSVCPSTLFN